MEIKPLDDFPILKKYLRPSRWAILGLELVAYKGEHICRVWESHIEFATREFYQFERGGSKCLNEKYAVAFARGLTFSAGTPGFPTH